MDVAARQTREFVHAPGASEQVHVPQVIVVGVVVG
jgi:hypothetical protein